MLKKFLLTSSIILFGLTPITWAQSLSISTQANSAGNGSSTFTLAEGKVSLTANQISFQATGRTATGFTAFAISGDNSNLALLKGNGSASSAAIFSSTGNQLLEYEVTNISAGDPSVAVYPYNNGSLLVRDNIVNFSFYDSFGSIITNVSGSSQSQGGESIAEVAMDPAAQTVIIYTPKIKNENALGSQAGYVGSDMRLQNFFYSSDRSIKYLDVSDNGQFVLFITAKEGDEDRVHVTDRYGNELAAFSSDENLKAAHISEDAGVVTIYSAGRVLVYGTLSGERLGSTSFRSEIIEADYFSEDDTIVTLTGSYNDSNGSITDAEFHAVNIEERKVERKAYSSGTLTTNDALELEFKRMGRNHYRLDGTNKGLDIRVSY